MQMHVSPASTTNFRFLLSVMQMTNFNLTIGVLRLLIVGSAVMKRTLFKTLSSTTLIKDQGFEPHMFVLYIAIVKKVPPEKILIFSLT